MSGWLVSIRADGVLSVGRLRHHLKFLSLQQGPQSLGEQAHGSSARMIRGLAIVTLQWKSDGNFSSVAWARFDLQRSADRADAFRAWRQAPAPSGAIPGRCALLNPAPSSRMVQHCVEILSPGTDPQVAGLRVLHRVSSTLPARCDTASSSTAVGRRPENRLRQCGSANSLVLKLRPPKNRNRRKPSPDHPGIVGRSS